MYLKQQNIPLVSVIMPAYNAAVTLQESVDSVVAQTFHNWELIIINDASIDNTEEIAKHYSGRDRRIRLTTNEINQGVAVSRNEGIKQAMGEYLAFLDSDDLWGKEKLQKQMHFMKQNNAIISFTGTAYMNAAGQISAYTLPAENGLGYKDLLRRNIMSCSSVIVRRDKMISFPSGYMHEDYASWLKVVKTAGQAYGLNEPLLVYRMGAHTKSAGRISSAIMTRNAYKEVGFGWLISTILMFRYSIHSTAKRRSIQQGNKT